MGEESDDLLVPHAIVCEYCGAELELIDDEPDEDEMDPDQFDPSYIDDHLH